jgi:hypothetical protein
MVHSVPDAAQVSDVQSEHPKALAGAEEIMLRPAHRRDDVPSVVKKDQCGPLAVPR